MEPLNSVTINEIKEMAGGEETILIELFNSFLNDAEDLTSKISSAGSKGDFEQLKFDVHTLKGLCGTIGANPLFEVCKVFNDELKSDVTNTVDKRITELVEKHEELVKYIHSNYNLG